MRQRLGIAASLLRRPRLLLLDEPATGLDPAGMRDMRALVKRLAEQGITVLLSSHLLFEVEELCNRVGVVSRGRVVREGRLADLLHEASGTYRLETNDPGRALEIVRTHGFADATRDRDAIRLRATPAAVGELSIALGRSGVGILVLAPEAASLEELFLRLTEDVAEPPAVAELTGAAR
jgi:ABC-2 type transport system ATP-binding protein